jgi:2',3'-cyclic-nucleotide 2'-phosphodiesterase (5'-nucleotidase family)
MMNQRRVIFMRNQGKKRLGILLTVILMLSMAVCSAAEEKAEKNGDIYILFTSDVHCGIDQGFGYAGLRQVRDGLEAKGYETILVDNGDSIQGESIGTLSRGEAIIFSSCRYWTYSPVC